MDAEDFVWNLADAEGVVPIMGLDSIPNHIRVDISRWLRRRAHSCGHTLRRHRGELDSAPLVVRIVGTVDAWCIQCTAERRVTERLRNCARCGRDTSGGHQTAFSLAGKTAVIGAWCGWCWNWNKEEDE